MKSTSCFGNFTLFKFDDEMTGKNINTIGSDDEVLSTSSELITDDKKSESFSKGHIVEIKLKELCNSVEKLTASTNWEIVKNTFENVKKEMLKLDNDRKYFSIHDKFEKLCSIFERRYNNHLMVKKAIDLKEQLCLEMETLLKETNIDDVKEKFASLKSQWLNSETVPERYEEVLKKKFKNLSECVTERLESLKKMLEENISIEILLEKCCEKAENIIQNKDFNKISSKLKDVEKEWEKLYEKASNAESLNERFLMIIADFNEKKELMSLEIEKKREEVNGFISRMEEYLAEKKIKNVLGNVKELQEQWDKLDAGLVSESADKKFNKLIKKYFSKLKYVQQKEDWARWENYTNKLLLCEKIEKLLEEKDTFKVAKEIKEIWESWRKIGQAPREKNDEIWERFNKTRQLLKVRCNDFFKNLKDERSVNTERKNKLCEQAEQLSDSAEWEETAEILKNIQKEWKEIGPAEKEIDDELYIRFKNACNSFFENRIEFYKKLHQKQAVNKKDKKQIIEEAERLNELEWKDAIRKIKKLRSQWKRVGSTSRQDEQKLWGRFNSLIESYLAELDASKPKNQEEKEKILNEMDILCKNLKSSLENSVDLTSKLNEIKSKWQEIGPVPRENENVIEDKYDELMKELSKVYQEVLVANAEKNTKNIKKKEEILVKLETLAEKGKFKENEKEFAKVCEEWKDLSVEIPDEAEYKLNLRFDKLKQAYISEDKKFFDVIKENKKYNLKKKIKICVELEKLADISSSSDLLTGEAGESLADELMFAIKGNFAAESTKKSDSPEDILKKYTRLKKEWSEIGVVPLDDYESINLRFNRVCSNIEANLK